MFSSYRNFQEEIMPRAKHMQGGRSDWGGARDGAGARRLEPDQKQQVVSFTLSPRTVAKLAALAKETGQSRSKLADQALREYLNRF
jgi:hypothetical protein